MLVRELLISLWKQRSWPLRDMGLDRWAELADLVQAPCGSRSVRTLPGGIQAVRDGDVLTMRAENEPGAC